jgi:hypothetical protein
MWTGVVWREAGNFGPGGKLEPRQSLGSHTFPHEPEVGFVIEIDDEQYQVTELSRVLPRPPDEFETVVTVARTRSTLYQWARSSAISKRSADHTRSRNASPTS